MDLIDLLNQYETVIFPNFDILQKAIKDILESFQHLREINDDKQLVKLNRKFNDSVDKSAKGTLKLSGDLEEVVGYFKMLTEDNVTANDLLETLLVLKDVAEKRIISSKESEKEFADFRNSILTADGIQPPNFLSALWQISLEVIWLIPIFVLPKLHIVTEKSNELNKTFVENAQQFNLFIANRLPSFVENAQQFNLFIANRLPLSPSHLPFCLVFLGFGYWFYYRKKTISKKAKGLIYAVKRNRLNNERKQKNLEEKISTKLLVISKYLETLTQFWTQQVDIFDSHINALKLVNENMNIRLQNNLAVGIIERCTEEKNNCKECYQMLKDYVYKYSV